MVLNDNARMRSCCFTGHRPEKLHWRATSVITALKAEIEQAITDGFNLFIVGMARGVDIWAAEIVLRLRNAGTPINLVCAIPYEGFELRWSAAWQERYRAILHAANQVEYINPCYSRACFQKRNIWMVDRSARVIAVYNGQSGGTRNTLRYAQKQGVDCHIIYDRGEKTIV